jgi:hypothetical protein
MPPISHSPTFPRSGPSLRGQRRLNARDAAPRWTAAVIAGSLALTLLGACSKAPEPLPPPPPPPPPATPRPTPIPTPKPTPTPPPTPTPKPTPTPIVKHYAPPGIYFVTEDITVHLPAGLLGLVAGTRVQMVADKGDTLQVTDGTDTFEVKKSQLTTEIEAATAMQHSAQAAQAAADQYRAQSDALLQKQQRDYIEFLKAHPLAVPTPTPTPGRS